MTKLTRYLNILQYLLLAVTLVFAGLYYFGGEVVGAAHTTPIYTDSFLNWGKLLVIITAGISLIFEVLHLIFNPKNAIRTLISIGIIFVIVFVAFGMSDATPMNLIGYEGSDNVPSMLTMAGTFLYTTYLLFGIAFTAILYTELSRLFK
ncbi:hypothetical protein DMA11_10795 [Marinilabiliaceae bacterium JC017]|nr:hypothetical protein DMA11_10795 [Marinilabiliaceae bacterium JC017]